LIPATPAEAGTRAFPAWTTFREGYALLRRQMRSMRHRNADYNVAVIDAVDELANSIRTLILWIWATSGASMEERSPDLQRLTMPKRIPASQTRCSSNSRSVTAASTNGGSPIMRPTTRPVGMAAEHTVRSGKQVGVASRGTRNPLSCTGPVTSRTPANYAPSSPTSSTCSHHLGTGRIPQPDTVDGIDQSHARLLVRSHFTNGAAAEHRPQQYFETVGNRGMYKDGWWLAHEDRAHTLGAHARCSQALRAGRSGILMAPRPSCTTCPTISPGEDLAAEHPEKVQELKDLFWEEGGALQVLPTPRHSLDLLRDVPRSHRRRNSSFEVTSRTVSA